METVLTKENIKNKKVIVLGLAVTGISVVRHLLELGALVTVNDWAPLQENKDAQTLIEENVRVIAGHHPVDLLDEEFAFMVKNPGISYSNPMVVRALQIGLPIYTDIELAGALTPAMIIGITGSNGKTTTTSLTHAILSKDRAFKGSSYVGGNIGIPALDVALKASADDRITLELSSFQLMGTKHFRPHIAAITNIFSAHLDYHGDLSAYIDAKWQITKNQRADDYLILNFDQEILRDRAAATAAMVVPFSTKEKLSNGAWYDADNDVFMWQEEVVLKREQLLIPGKHNIENMLVAIAIVKILGVSNETISEAVSGFYGVEHRLQFVRELKGRKFYNDSKATNNDAAITALNSFQQPIIWLAGGLDRHNSLDELIPAMQSVKTLIAFGETAAKFAELGTKANIENIIQVEWIEDAVKQAYASSEPGDVVLLSPASASWDQYPNYEIRGSRFVKAVNQLKEETGD